MNCREPGTNPDDWFAVAGSKRSIMAKALCKACPLMATCRSYALSEGITDGIWGGLDKTDREAIWATTGGRPSKFHNDIDAALGPLHSEPDDVEPEPDDYDVEPEDWELSA